MSISCSTTVGYNNNNPYTFCEDYYRTDAYKKIHNEFFSYKKQVILDKMRI